MWFYICAEQGMMAGERIFSFSWIFPRHGDFNGVQSYQYYDIGLKGLELQQRGKSKDFSTKLLQLCKRTPTWENGIRYK